MQLLQRHVLLGRGVRTVVVGRLVPSKGLLLVRRALDESIESAVPYVELPAGLYLQKVCYWYVEPLMRASNLAVPYAELSAVPHVELQFVRSTGTLLSRFRRPPLLPGTFPYLLMLRAYTALGIECSKSVRGTSANPGQKLSS